MNPITFRADSKFLSEFSILEIIVHCPKCGAQAKVKYGEASSKLSCPSCGLKVLSSSGKWYGPVLGVVNKKCLSCGQPLYKTFTRWSEKPKIILCEKCKKSSTYKVAYRANITGKPYDPFFGAGLLLQSVGKNGIVWFYNQEHLQFVENYISAKIRIREPNVNRSLASRLPQWIMKSKNRDEVLKIIEKIKRKNAV